MHRDEVRLQIARLEIPPVLLGAGALVLAISVVTLLQETSHLLSIHLLDACCALVLFAIAVVIRRTRIPSTAVPWLFVLAAVALQLTFLYEGYLEPDPITFAYLVIVMTAFGPVTLDWRAFATAAAAMMIGVTVYAVATPGGRGAESFTVALTALLVGAMLLLTRLRSIYGLADAQDLAQQLATTDELTGLLNRHGLQAQLGRMTSMARRMDKGLFAVFVDIDGLKAANDRHGHGFGDEVIEAAASAVLASVRAGDLVARWGGDEIVVLGIGAHPDPAAFADRLEQNVAAIGIDRDRWPGHLSVGFAEADASAEADGVEQLIERADFDMYGRRKSR